MNGGEERRQVVRALAREWKKDGLLDAEVADRIEAAIPSPWRSHGVVVQAVFFVLSSIGVAAFYGFLSAASMPGEGIVTGIAAIALAEYLIQGRRWFWTGVEAALWLGGVIALIMELPRSGTPESLLVLAAGAGVAGFRVRNPVIGALAAVLVVAWAESRFDLGFIAALAIATAALLALMREWQRPSTEWLLAVNAVVMPIAGWIAADAVWRAMTFGLSAVFAAGALVLAIRLRHHACFAAAAVGAAIAVTSLAQLTRAQPELVLGASGAVLLTLSLLVSRALRDRVRGFVLTPVRIAAIDEGAIAIGSALAAVQAATPAGQTSTERPQDDGGFGGAGATGSY